MSDHSEHDLERMRIDLELEKLKNEEKKLALDTRRLEVDQQRVLVNVNKPLIDGMFKFAELTVRSLLILNGGAAIGLLTFAAKAFEAKPVPQALACALFIFGLGAVMSVILAGASYLAQYFYNRTLSGKSCEKVGYVFHGLAVIAAVLGLVAFGYGMLKAAQAFT